MIRPRRPVAAAAAVAVLFVTACANDASSGSPAQWATDAEASVPSPASRPTPSPTPSPSPPPAVELRAPATGVLYSPHADRLAVEAARTFYATAPVVVLAPRSIGGRRQAAATAVRLGLPVLAAAGPGAREPTAVLTDLDVTATLPYGGDARLDGVSVADLPRFTPPADPADEVLVLYEPSDVGSMLAVATARAAGAETLAVPGGDPRLSPPAIAALAGHTGPVLAMGTDAAFADAEEMLRRIGQARTGLELPGGGQIMFPHRMFVALYGHPGSFSLGVLGEQDVDATLERAREHASWYEDLVDVPVVPTLEIIATVASGVAGPDGDYSRESTVEALRPWVDAAKESGVYVVLDLQPGRTDFLTQAKRYTPLLLEPHVGLALDPEWRLRPGEVHLRQVGSVHVDEVNQVADWLAALTAEAQLPQKLFVVHQFLHSMIVDRARLDTSHEELAMLIQMDGQGGQASKDATFRSLTADPPAGVWWGWKNFYDEDHPAIRTPADTMTAGPTVWFVSYQ